MFVIIGLVVVIAIIGVYFGVSSFGDRASRRYFESASVGERVNVFRENIQGCISDLTLNSIYLIGDQGGYYTRPERYYGLGEDEMIYGDYLSYYFYNGEVITTEIDEMNRHLSRFVEDSFESCLQEYSDDFFSFDVNPRVAADVGENGVDFKFNGNVVLNSEGHSMTIDLIDYSEFYRVNLYGIHEVVNYLTESHYEDETLYCLSCLVAMLEERNLYLDYYTMDENNILVVITDRESDFADEYYFLYVNRYTGQEVSRILSDNFEDEFKRYRQWLEIEAGR